MTVVPRIFPAGPKPRMLASGESTDFVPIGVAPALIMRLVVLGDPCQAPGAEPPRVRLRAGTGVPVELTSQFTDVTEAGNTVATARILAEDNDVYQVLISSLGALPSSLAVQIRNNDAKPRQFAWAVGEDDDAASQPWIDISPGIVHFGVLQTGDKRSGTVQVGNLGPGTLIVGEDNSLPDGYAIISPLPLEIKPNHCASVTFEFTAANTTSDRTDVLSLTSNDPVGVHAGSVRVSTTAPFDPPPVPQEVPDGPGRCMQCGCSAFMAFLEGPHAADPDCKRPGCGHPFGKHRPPI